MQPKSQNDEQEWWRQIGWRLTPAILANTLTENQPPASRFLIPPHIEFLSNFLAPRIRAGNARVLVSMPPRHGKSEHNSHWLPVWFLDWWPSRRVMLPSYEADFAASWGRKVRNSIQEYSRSLRVRVADDRSAADDWITTRGGGMMTAGVGGAFVGRGANLLLPDDLIKNAEQANSETYREKMWEWWQSTIYTRLEPGGSVVATATRWNEKDLHGRLIGEMRKNGEKWEVINLPAIAEKIDQLGRRIGAALWPDRYPLAVLNRIKIAVGNYVWNSQFQQNPVPRSGGYYKRHWFKVVKADRVPRFEKIVRFWDLAATTEDTADDPDWTVGLRAGITSDNQVYITNVKRVRESPSGVERLVRQTANIDGTGVVIRMEQEPGSSGKDVIYNYAHRILNAFDFRGKKASGEKTVRAGPSCAAAERGDVFIVEGDWNEAFVDELAAFDKGSHDDQVDAFSGAYNYLTGSAEVWSVADWEKVFDEDGHKHQTPMEMLRALNRGEQIDDED